MRLDARAAPSAEAERGRPAAGMHAHRRAARLLVCCALMLLCASATVTHTQAQSSALPEGYSALIDEALGELRVEHFVEARALFLRAHALYPNARTLRGLGMMAYELRSYAESMSYLEQALASTERPLDAALRAETEELLGRARRFVVALKLVLAPPETRVLLDGARIAPSAAGDLRLDAGLHSLTFEAPGYRSQTRALDGHGGESLVWSIALPLSTPAPAPDAAASAPDASEVALVPATVGAAAPARSDRPPLYKNPWIWVGTVLAAGAIAAGVAIALRPDAKKVEDPPVETPQSPPNGILMTLLEAR